MTADTLGGVWSYALELAGALSERGAAVALATLGREPDASQADEARSIPGLGLFPSAYRCEWMEDPWVDVARSCRWLREVAEDFRPDVVHLNSFGQATEAFGVPVVVVAHSCLLSWWSAVRGGDPPARYRPYRRAVARALHAADLVVTPTHGLMRALRAHYGAHAPFAVVPNGRAPERFRPLPKEDVIFACGRLWDDAKNLAALEAAAPHLEWPVQVAGPLRHPTGGDRVARGVHCIGSLDGDQIARRMGRAAICAHPARYEPFGLVPLEAALCGCSLVLGDIATLREVWGDAALYAAPDDHAELVACLRRLMRSPVLRSQLAARARARALELGTDRMVDAYLAVYERAGTATARPAGETVGVEASSA